MSDQSMLWGASLHFWDVWGVRALIGSAILGAFTVLLTFASAYVLYRVADEAQAELRTVTDAHAVELEERRRETAEAVKRAADAQLALERFRAPRSIEKEQRHFFVPLGRFAGTKARVWSLTGGPDISSLAEQIAGMLRGLNWSVETALSESGKSDPGVVVAVRIGANVDNQARELIEDLNSAGIPTRLGEPFANKESWLSYSAFLSNVMGPEGYGPPLVDMIVVVGPKQ